MARGRRDHHDQLIEAPYRQTGENHRLTVRVTPKAGRDGLAGVVALRDGRSALSVRLAAAPVDNAANRALIAYLSKLLHIGKPSLRIVSGEASRLKTVEIQGSSHEALARLIDRS